MAIGVLGLPSQTALVHVEEGLGKGPDFVAIPHHPMEEQTVLENHRKHKFATLKIAQVIKSMASNCF
jgi:hypothetical protein